MNDILEALGMFLGAMVFWAIWHYFFPRKDDDNNPYRPKDGFGGME